MQTKGTLGYSDCSGNYIYCISIAYLFTVCLKINILYQYTIQLYKLKLFLRKDIDLLYKHVVWFYSNSDILECVFTGEFIKSVVLNNVNACCTFTLHKTSPISLAPYFPLFYDLSRLQIILEIKYKIRFQK